MRIVDRRRFVVYFEYPYDYIDGLLTRWVYTRYTSAGRVPGIQQPHLHLVLGTIQDGWTRDAWAQLVHDVA